MNFKSQNIDDYLFRYAEMLKYGEINFKIDHQSQLHAIIAIHNTSRGPAIGVAAVVLLIIRKNYMHWVRKLP